MNGAIRNYHSALAAVIGVFVVLGLVASAHAAGGYNPPITISEISLKVEQDGQALQGNYIARGQTFYLSVTILDNDPQDDPQPRKDQIASAVWERRKKTGETTWTDWEVQSGSTLTDDNEDRTYDSVLTQCITEDGTYQYRVKADDLPEYDPDPEKTSGTRQIDVMGVDYIVADPDEATIAIGASAGFNVSAWNNGPDGDPGGGDDIPVISTFDWSLDAGAQSIGDLDAGTGAASATGSFAANAAGNGAIIVQIPFLTVWTQIAITALEVTVTVTPNPGYAKVNDGTLTFTAVAKDAGDQVLGGAFTWSTTIGNIASAGENTATFTAGEQTGDGTVTAKHENTNATGTATVYVVAVDIQPDDGQCGENGDLVASNQGEDGEKHYVSPKAGANDFVVLKAIVAPAQVTFENAFQWEGGEEVEGHPEKRQVPRGATGKTVVKAKLKVGGDECDRINVWIVWATFAEPVRIQDATFQYVQVDPKVGDLQEGQHVRSRWRFLATIAPASILDETEDIPNLKGADSQPVPDANEAHIVTGALLGDGAEKRWDISRQMRIRILSPSVGTDDYSVPGGTIHDDLPDDNKIAEDYPADPAAGNDDEGANDEDNNPYSDNEFQLGTDPLVKTPKGKLASYDAPTCPSFIRAAGDANDTVEFRLHFREFVRLQIGNSAEAGYRNWYRVSDYVLWRHVGKVKKNPFEWWVDDGSTAEADNEGW